MKAKTLEGMLAAESGMQADMVTRFQRLREFNLLRRARGRNAEFLDADEVVSGLLSMVASRPGFAAVTASGLRRLKPVGNLEEAFAKSGSLAQALARALEDEETVKTVKHVRLGDSDSNTRCATSAEIAYDEEGTLRTTQYMPDTALTLFGPGKAEGFDRLSVNAAVQRELVITGRLLRKVARAMRQAREALAVAEQLSRAT
ncbi:hypothetical protein [Mesorhizobium sp.]|uniref:hypothetical protein n=1 Tax=Mesorhizobium sp. TaxID=1871066 RepID=UPI00121CCBC4|nr:hypothetical protein [Mesorhizobium sp.]TIM06371.1 MAG: hypothetical protein E5Y62_24315 [Mesorhizobium sp.]